MDATIRYYKIYPLHPISMNFECTSWCFIPCFLIIFLILSCYSFHSLLFGFFFSLWSIFSVFNVWFVSLWRDWRLKTNHFYCLCIFFVLNIFFLFQPRRKYINITCVTLNFKTSLLGMIFYVIQYHIAYYSKGSLFKYHSNIKECYHDLK